MKNKVIISPTAEDALALFSEFECGDNGIISLSAEDFINTINGASTAVVVEGSGSGPQRLKESVAKAMKSFKVIVPNLNPYKASKLLCLAVIGDDFSINETNQLTEFFKNYSDKTDIIWGVSKKKEKDDVTARLLLSFE